MRLITRKAPEGDGFRRAKKREPFFSVSLGDDDSRVESEVARFLRRGVLVSRACVTFSTRTKEGDTTADAELACGMHKHKQRVRSTRKFEREEWSPNGVENEKCLSLALAGVVFVSLPHFGIIIVDTH